MRATIKWKLPLRSGQTPIWCRWLAGLAACLALPCVSSVAQTPWINPNGGLWYSGSNWAGGSPPGPSGLALFNLNSPYRVIWNGSDSVTSGLVVGAGSVTFENATSAARQYTVLGNAAITGADTVFVLGNNSGNVMQLTAGGIVVNSEASVGVAYGGRLNTSGTLSLGSSGFVQAAAGGTIQAASVRIGEAGMGFGIVQGTGSQLTTSGTMFLAYSSNGFFDIRDGGRAQSNATVIGQNAGTFGQLSVYGTGSRLEDGTSGGASVVGVNGEGTLNIEAGGLAAGHTLTIGLNTGSRGTVNVYGSGSLLDRTRIANSDINVGLGGTGVLNVNFGGTVATRTLFLGDSFSGGNGTVTVSGTGSTMNLGYLRTNAGSLAIQSGGRVNVGGYALLGEIGNSTVTVTGPGSSLVFTKTEPSSHGLTIGSSAAGSLHILDGGLVSGVSGQVGYGSGANGTVNISGTGSTWNNESALLAGYCNGDSDTAGTINVQAGGTLTSSAAELGVNWAGIGRATGTVTVNGAGSKWINAGDLTLSRNWNGTAGTGLVNIENQGLVTSGGNLFIGNGGQVRLNGGRFEFGSTDVTSFSRVVTNSGSAAGNIIISGTNNLASMNALISNGADLNHVYLVNSGLLQGSNQVDVSLLNTATGQLSAGSGDWIRFRGNESQNAGLIQNNGGALQFARLSNLADGVIEGRGGFVTDTTLTNLGLMSFSSGNTDLIGDVQNLADGVISTSALATTVIHGNLLHQGAAINTAGGSVTRILGRASGSGDYHGEGTVIMEGGFDPGSSPATIHFYGHLAFGSNNITSIELGGTQSGEFDQFLVDGNLTLGDSLLQVSLLDDFALEAGMQFLIGSPAGSLNGQFSGLGEGALVGNFNGTDLFITYQGPGGNPGFGLFTTAAIPEPAAAALLMAVALASCLSRRRSSLASNHGMDRA